MFSRWLARVRRLARPQGPWWGPLLCLAAVLCGWGLGLWVRQLRSADLQQQRARLERLSPDQLQALLRQMRRWERMAPQQRQRILRLHQQVEADPRRQQLLDAMQRFHRWLMQVPLDIQFDMLNSDAPAEDRVEQFRKLYLQWLGSRRLDAEELDALVLWWRKQLIARGRLDPDKPLRIVPRPFRLGQGQRPRLTGRPMAERILLELLHVGLGRGREAPVRRIRRFLESLDDDAYEELVRSWPRATAGQWSFVRTPDEKRRLVLRWTVSALLNRNFPTRPQGKDWQLDHWVRQFQQLPSSAQAWLLDFPPDRFFQNLRAYSREHPRRFPSPAPRRGAADKPASP